MENHTNTHPRVLVSACLMGEPCRYDGASKPNQKIIELLKDRALPCCPEELGGMPTPRAPSEIVGRIDAATGADVLENNARVIDAGGNNQTERFIAGAEETLSLAQEGGIKLAVLKERSPSCDPENGVCANLLRKNGFKVIGSLDLTEEFFPENSDAEITNQSN